MRQMSREQWRAFVSAGGRTGKLATVRADGRPHVVPVWFVLDGEDLVFTTWHTSVKAVNLRRDPRAALCVEDDRPPYSFVMVEGGVRFEESPEAVLPFAIRIATRYLGSELGERYGARNGVAGELLARLAIERVVAQADIAD
ncbi:MAG TPA: PPOX class F420-dependent oxidoreductase [Mycobacteriales bacterium]